MKESLLLTPREMIGVSDEAIYTNTEPEQKRFFLNPASQNKSVENERSSGVSSETPLDMACSLS
jgi:hypothetical protein